MSFQLHQGSSALLVSLPHVGTEIPPELQPAYVPRALALEDTDWHLERLYDFLHDLGASVLTPRYSRYVIDLNRPPDDAPMYPGAANTELIAVLAQALHLPKRDITIVGGERSRSKRVRIAGMDAAQALAALIKEG